jgi:glycosyltransferase domain-containing protein
MLINDPAAFSLVVPTYNGTPFLRRTLDYFAEAGFEGQIVLSDNSAPESRAYVERCAADYPGLSIRVCTYPEPTRFLDKLVDTLEQLPSRCVMLHAHDDFFVPEETDACVRFLESQPAYAVARGRVARVRFMRGPGTDPSSPPELRISMQTMRSYEQDDPLERLIDHVGQFTPTFYSVHRRTNLIECYALTEAATQNVIFFQHLFSAIAALQGKIHTSDWLFYVRQGHPRSWSQSLTDSGDYEHWPRLIVSPHYSRYYSEFRKALCDLACERFGADPAAFGTRIDNASIALIRRGFCQIADEPDDKAHYLERAQNPGSPEHTFLRQLGNFIMKYPDTY